MIYQQECPHDNTTIEAVVDHVRAHLSSVVSPDDDDLEYYSLVNISVERLSNGIALVKGELPGHLRPSAPYLDLARRVGVTPPGLATQIQRGLDKHKVPWRIQAGAPSRGNGQSWGSLEGAIMHHTATASGRAPAILWQGRAGLSGPLCNTAGEPDGTVVFVAYHPANHAGASGGRATEPLPVTRTFNKRVWGHEIVYPGNSPMSGAQYRSAIVLANVIAEIVGGDFERIRAHAETSITGKWDPGYAQGRTIDMVAFRNAARTIPGIEMTLTNEERIVLDLIYVQLAGHGSKPGEFKGWPMWPGGEGGNMTLVDYMRRNNVDVQTIKRQLAALDPAKIASSVVQQLTPLIRDAVAAAVKERIK